MKADFTEYLVATDPNTTGALVSNRSGLKLSICITTLNRAALIRDTIESILVQLTEECELVILDAASSDGSDRILRECAARCDRLRYIRQEENNGWDRDCNRVVELASGDYCWLMTDDDVFKEGAVAAVLRAISGGFGFIFVNSEARVFDMSKVVEARHLDFEDDRVYGTAELDRIFVDVGAMLTYVGGFVVKREIWLSRDKESHYGTLFCHVGVVFQAPLPGGALVIARPFISYRMGNVHTWSSRTFETFLIKWPALVWSLGVSDSAKREVCNVEPWRSFRELFWCRGRGCYSMAEYKLLIRPRLKTVRERLKPVLIALLPGVLVNGLSLLYFFATKSVRRGVWLQVMRESPYHFRNWRIPLNKRQRTCDTAASA